ncbi:DNA topoisomerase IV subunit B [Aquaspirillum sp. LM1]|uniref:DNA topoisomerase IV subunit B n=1 Tax=Aquaspirillum sp. LM1 TaxID=1938604 RepID=UPI000983CBDA|nr:DNA topoisomerase IV subunit B [Aquaspirillum sp. LM1]AQR64033.1 DNA topoisomerase IV subunit B [Aquaspirillum sp. LM1]
MSKSYDESSVRVLKGLEPVKERPGMYTRTTDPTHICQEVIDNAADEALGGFARKIAVTLHLDGSLSVEDDGRGIPVGLHPDEGVPVVELVFTRLHAGGKFNKKDGGAYAFSGGLHGVGVSVTNALSTRLEVEVKREGAVWQLAFSGGDVIEALQQTGACPPRSSGTRVRVWPDARYFESPRYSLAELERLLRAKAVLLPGVAVTLTLEKADGQHEVRSWRYPDGLKSYLVELFGDDEPVAPPFAGENYIGADHEQFSRGEGAAWALAWFEHTGGGESYVNLIPTASGGTHEAGLRTGVFEAVKSFVDHHNLLPRGVKLQAEDVWGRVRFVLSARVLDPQFQGQTKEKLNNRDALKLVSSLVRDPLEIWLNAHVDDARKIAELAIRQAQSRLKSVKKVEKKKGSGVAVLPGKLTDCESEDIQRNELFLVEGDSAGGSAKLARDKEYQAILPLRGKVLNSWETDRDQLFSNAEIHDIAVAIGVDPHGASDSPDLSGLRYGKIAILSDADVDGSHIQVLLLTLFYRHFPALIRAGHIYIAKPPLYRIDVPGQGKTRPLRKFYALDDAELDSILDRLRSEQVRDGSWSIGRFKGLGEMNPEQLKDTTMHPDTRRLSRVVLPSHDGTDATFTMLMGKGEAASRRAWMEEKGNSVEADV